MSPMRDGMRARYGALARRYDFLGGLYRYMGFREEAYRRRAVGLLRLKPGDSVVDLGCGTGLNFPLLVERIGPSGRLIGVDLTPEMLERARERVDRIGFVNVELVLADMAEYTFPKGVRAVLSTLALGLVPDHRGVITRAVQALAPGGRLVILDMKRPDRWPLWLVRFALWVTKPFGVTPGSLDRRPWEGAGLQLEKLEIEEHYLGFIYIASGSAGPSQVPKRSSTARRDEHL